MYSFFLTDFEKTSFKVSGQQLGVLNYTWKPAGAFDSQLQLFYIRKSSNVRRCAYQTFTERPKQTDAKIANAGDKRWALCISNSSDIVED